MQRIFLGFIAFCATLGAAVGIFLYVSAIPYIGLIGKFVAALLIVAVLCGAWLLVIKTWTWTGIMRSERIRARNHERFLSAPAEQHSIYLQELEPRFSIHEVSANVVAAGVPRMLPAPKDEPPLEATDETIVELWQDGQMTLETIALQLKTSYYRVQRVTSEAKKRGVVRK